MTGVYPIYATATIHNLRKKTVLSCLWPTPLKSTLFVFDRTHMKRTFLKVFLISFAIQGGVFFFGGLTSSYTLVMPWYLAGEFVVHLPMDLFGVPEFPRALAGLLFWLTPAAIFSLLLSTSTCLIISVRRSLMARNPSAR